MVRARSRRELAARRVQLANSFGAPDFEAQPENGEQDGEDDTCNDEKRPAIVSLGRLTTLFWIRLRHRGIRVGEWGGDDDQKILALALKRESLETLGGLPILQAW
jgi:hypothetical protein